MKINYTSLHNMNEAHISFEAIKRSAKQKQEEVSNPKKTNKRKNNVVRGFKRIAWESV